MIEKQYLLFDLDGTLTDPIVGITKSVRYALKYFEIEVEDLNRLKCFIGPPLKDSFVEYYGFSEEKSAEAVDRFREYFSEKGIYENQEYPGIEEMLKALKAAGKTLLVATSKPEEFAVKILEYFHLDGYFEFIGGARMDETRTKKADVIRHVLDTRRITDLKSCVMIGDRKHDILGAAELGIEAIGVLYGYGNQEELEVAGAVTIAADVQELKELLLEKTV